MKRVLLDACVLYPTVMREVLLGAAQAGLYEPLWSERILEEWARAAARRGALDEAQARGEIAVARANWPKASVEPRDGDLARLWLPDEDDIHVLASAIAGSADALVTLNIRDFPRHTLSEEGLDRIDPDGFLYGLWLEHPEALEAVGSKVLEQAEKIDNAPHDLRKLLKKARLPRLAKALAT